MKARESHFLVTLIGNSYGKEINSHYCVNVMLTSKMYMLKLKIVIMITLRGISLEGDYAMRAEES